MQLTPQDIDKVQEIGLLDGNKVSLVRTKGGFWIALGKKRNKASEEALAAGSHPAIVKYNLEKQFPDFRPALTKSESGIEPIVAKHSHFLSDDLRKSGHDIFSIQTGNVVDFQITKHNSKVANASGYMDSDNLCIDSLDIPKRFVRAMAGSTLEKAIECKVGLKLKQ
jgi:hypothetical protein